MTADARVFKGLDALSGWGDATRYLQNARRQKDKEFDRSHLERAIEVLESGTPLDAVAPETVQCPLCPCKLSTEQRRLGPFVWGKETAIHYLAAHKIWPDELDWLLSYAAVNAA